MYLSLKLTLATAAMAFSFSSVSLAAGKATVGQSAPAFTLVDVDGKNVSLSDYKGKTVVLEWFNDDCPYVEKHYGSGNMQKLQTQATNEGVTWLSIVSSAAGKQGHLDGASAKKIIETRKAKQSKLLLDPKGEVGKLYGAQTTPHMYVIDKTGKLVYQGAIDDQPSTDTKEMSKARNYVVEALAAVEKNETPKVASTKPYGCSVKY